jgi:hypothetical protein
MVVNSFEPGHETTVTIPIVTSDPKYDSHKGTYWLGLYWIPPQRNSITPGFNSKPFFTACDFSD